MFTLQAPLIPPSQKSSKAKTYPRHDVIIVPVNAVRYTMCSYIRQGYNRTQFCPLSVAGVLNTFSSTWLSHANGLVSCSPTIHNVYITICFVTCRVDTDHISVYQNILIMWIQPVFAMDDGIRGFEEMVMDADSDDEMSCEIAIRWMSLDPIDGKSTLIQVMAWCRQVAKHTLSQCWPRSMTPYGATSPHWIKMPFRLCKFVWKDHRRRFMKVWQ